MKNIVTIVGARPQFIKAAPLGMALAKVENFRHSLIHTGQHFDANMSKIFFTELGIQAPEVNLGINGKTHGVLTGRILEALDEILPQLKADMVIIYGDTDSTLAGCLSAVKMHIPVAHIEAGLRSFNRKMPEEVNRVLVDHASDLLLCPTKEAMKNLKEEGITDKAHNIGDVMYDMCLLASRKAGTISTILEKLALKKQGYNLATIHRAENTNSKQTLQAAISYIKEAAQSKPVIFPLHPRTRIAAERFGISLAGLTTIDPVGYFDMIQLLQHAATLYTDSGGLQKEAFFLQTPCITLRDETEWVETVEAGHNRLWHTPNFLPKRDIAPYGDGHAAEQAINIIKEYF
ncbi:non-hydrolyzing UDP-N-acetylglucosamine 2-epimerase [Maridesulfovibrio bastinii]|uniref:non-hydrolyzing UDP-N-acetylglucosamine 2-epimerase n=1 Tax=Maridesulfovibrio bastinii TaxID=47157 RepID=UPI00041C3DE3|nr:UDP-N-acetylglucosamine 2-epimerase (non-hydrolyzing) [Maridesulfovibrio bastinii]